eukprot:RCo007657
MPTLTVSQRNDLHEAIAEYFQAHGFSSTLSAFRQESSQKSGFSSEDTKLEKKWFVNLKLQQRVLQLEKELAELEKERSRSVLAEKPREKAEDGFPAESAKLTLLGHRETVSCVRFHPTFSLIASSSEDCTIHVWDFESGQHESTLRGHTGIVNFIDLNEAGNVLASCSADTTVKLWSFPSGPCTRTLAGHDHTVSCVRFVPASEKLVSCSRDHTLRIWDSHSGFCKLVLRGHEEWVRSVVVSFDGTLLASGGLDQTIRLWDTSTGQCTKALSARHVVECLAFAHAAADAAIRTAFPLLASQSPAASGGKAPASPPAADGKAAELAGSKATRLQFLVSGSRDKEIHCWDISSGLVLFTLRGHDDWVRSICFSRGGKFLFSCGDDWTIRVWEISSQRCRRKIAEAHGHFVACLAAHPTRPVLASGSVDKSVKIWSC